MSNKNMPVNFSMNNTINLTKEYILDFLLQYVQHIGKTNINLDEFADVLYTGCTKQITEGKFYDYVANTCASKECIHPDYGIIASRVCVDKLHCITPTNMSVVAELLYNNTDKKGVHHPLITKKLYNIIQQHKEKIQNVLQLNRDYDFTYFGIRTLERSYLLRIHGKSQIVERPQHMIMRVALAIHGNHLKEAFETYNLISQRYFTHATPTLFNAGCNFQQLSSCYLLGIGDDMENILDQWKQIGQISKFAGGIGVHLTAVRCRGSIIRGTNGISEGIIPLCLVLNTIARYINQGGKRPGSIACYLEPHHPDIFEFCELRKHTGDDNLRARDLYLAMWISDLFMRRVAEDGIWSLMCPHDCPDLNTTHSEEYERLYLDYEARGLYVRQVKAQDLWKHILDCQIETGFPYMLYKDNINKKCNQKNLGTIRSSNLCSEITEYSDENETSVCNLCSICLPQYIEKNNKGKKYFNFEKLVEVCRVIVRNLNKVIDINYYPTASAKTSNNRHRPIGVGVQGLADVYNIMEYPFESAQARELNKLIFESIYYGCLDESKELAKLHGKYETFAGSPFSHGQLQFHLWGLSEKDLSGRYNWTRLSDEIRIHGTRNSLLTSLMPTASTSQIMNCSECFEPVMSNVFTRSTSAGQFIVINKNLVNKLIELDLWNEDMHKLIMIYNGSIQKIDSIPYNVKRVYKTAFEIQLKSIIKQSLDRSPFVDQSQSMNLFMNDPDFTKLTMAHFYGWRNGIKTGMYYLRTTPAVNPIQFGIDIDDIKRLTGIDNINDIITSGYGVNDNGDTTVITTTTNHVIKECLMCSS
jgi:ribonucleoside-diphosphate reductase alpha chain